MNEKTLYNLSLFCFLIGIFLILIINEKIDISKSNISMLNASLLDQKVNVKGIAYNIIELDELYLFNLKDSTGNITIIAFNIEKDMFKEQDILEVEGDLVVYKDKLEIEASKIKKF